MPMNLFFLFSILTLPVLQAHIAVPDDYWKQRQAEARSQTLRAYDPNPFNVTDHLNYHVSLAFEGHNSTRRELRRKFKKCLPSNPIDRCWRCDPNWEQNRKRLADCALGFGRRAIGGKNGPIYVVIDPSDDDVVNPKPGTLRYGATRNGPLWIIFARSMVISLNQELIITSDKTIDGRGANVQIRGGAGFTLQFVNNVIIHNLHFHYIAPGSGGLIRDSENHFGLRTKSDGDAISVFGSSNIWIDHVSMSRCADGLVDIVQGSTGITISNSHFTDHNEVMLFGATDNDKIDAKMQVTLAFNHFGKRLVQRMPRCRFGLIHVVNNDYTHWEMYAIGGSQNPTIISQGNRFIAPHSEQCKQVTKREYTTLPEWSKWIWRSEKDYFLNGAFFVQSGRPNAWTAAPAIPIERKFAIRPLSGKVVSTLTKDAGTLRCKVGRPC